MRGNLLRNPLPPPLGGAVGATDDEAVVSSSESTSMEKEEVVDDVADEIATWGKDAEEAPPLPASPVSNTESLRDIDSSFN